MPLSKDRTFPLDSRFVDVSSFSPFVLLHSLLLLTLLLLNSDESFLQKRSTFDSG